MLIGYIGTGRARARQRAALRALGVGETAIFEGPDRLASCLATVGPGDTLAVWRVGQLGRDLRERIGIVSRLATIGVSLVVLAGRKAGDDGALMSGVFAALAGFAHDLEAGRAEA